MTYGIPTISRCTGLISTKFSPNGSYMIVDERSDLLFPIAQGMLPWQPILEQNYQNLPTPTLFSTPPF